MNYIKTAIPYLLAVMIGAWTGFWLGTQYYPRVETKTVAVDKPVYVQGAATTETKTQIAYIPKKTDTSMHSAKRSLSQSQRQLTSTHRSVKRSLTSS